MTKKEISNFVKQKLEPYFINNGFHVDKAAGDILFSYSKITNDCAYGSSGYLLKYVNLVLVYHFGFGINRVVALLREIDKTVRLSKGPYVIANTFMSISPGSVLFPKEPERPYKSFADELELELSIFDIQAFHQSYFAPFCEKYKDVERLDKLFNRLDDFRDKDFDFPNLSFFHITRLIIARLANNPNYEKIVERNFEDLENIWQKNGWTYDRTDESNPEVFAAKFLRDLKIT